jgi:hypothetical protein
MSNPLRPVTIKRPCRSCEKKFNPARRDAKYCSDACRQRAHRARASMPDLDRQIEQARLLYWNLIAQKARALGRSPSQVVTGESLYVDREGYVWTGGVLTGAPWRCVGYIDSARKGWTVWGSDAAGPPWSPPGPGIKGIYEQAILGRPAKKKTGRE